MSVTLCVTLKWTHSTCHAGNCIYMNLWYMSRVMSILFFCHSLFLVCNESVIHIDWIFLAQNRLSSSVCFNTKMANKSRSGRAMILWNTQIDSIGYVDYFKQSYFTIYIVSAKLYFTYFPKRGCQIVPFSRGFPVK